MTVATERSLARPGDRGWRHRLTIAFFLLPSAMIILLVTVIPMIGATWVSLHDWNLISPMRWTGLSNYQYVLTSRRTWTSLGYTLYYVAGYLPLVYFGGLALAVALNAGLRGRSFFRLIYFLPVVTSWVVAAILWQWLLQPANGLVNHLLGLVGITGPGWYTDPTWIMPSVILASAWKDVGFIMIIMLAGLQAIPAELKEAAAVDGANLWQRFWRITFPLLTPTTFFVVVTSVIGGLQVFDQVYIMTTDYRGGSSPTQVVVGQIYDLTFRYGRAGEASALSWVLFLTILSLTVLLIRGQRRWVKYE
jgi:multiple sugar transport system permease protein